MSPGSAAALDAGDAIRSAEKAAAHCRARELEEASQELQALLQSLESEYGAAHTSARVLRLNVAHVERALGRTPDARLLEVLPTPPGPEAELAPGLSAALRSLRSCARARPRRPSLSEGANAHRLEDGDFEPHLAAARRFLNQGSYREALAAAELAHGMAAKAPAADARMRAAETLALARLQLGDRAGALSAALEAKESAQATGAVASRIVMARLVAQAGDLDGAGLELEVVEADARTPALRAELDEARGDLALRLGAPERARGHLERALEGHRATFGKGHASTAGVLHRLGDAHRMTGDLAAATAAYGEALTIRTAVLGAGHPETSRTQNAMGVLLSDFGDWDGADAAFSAAHTRLSQTLGSTHPETVTVAANRALARWGAQPGSAAATQYAEAVAAMVEAFGVDHPSSAAAWRNLARIEEERGNFDRAEQLLSRALAAQTAAFGGRHPDLAATRLARGRIQDRRGESEAAALELSAALEILTSTYGEEHPLVSRARVALARNAAGRGDHAGAWEQAREAGRVLDVHVRRSFDAMPDRQRAFLADDASDVVGVLLSAQGAPAAQAYASMLPHRDSVLRSIAASRSATRRQGGEGQETLAKLARLRERYVLAALGETPEVARRARELAREIDALEAIAALAGAGGRALDSVEIMNSACRRIPADAVLIEFVAYDAATGPGEPVPSYAGFIVTPEGCRVERVDLGPAGPVDAAAEQFALAMRDQQSDAAKARQRLGTLLLKPLREALAGRDRWLVVPDAALWGVPLGALPDPAGLGDTYVIERVTVGYLTSLVELAEAGSAVGGAALSSALLFGAPTFGEAEAAGGPMVLTASGPCRLPPFEPLPATEREIEEIRGLLSEPRVISGADATKQRLRSELSTQPRVLHLATHAYFAGTGACEGESTGSSLWGDGHGPVAGNPLLLSGIVFAGANAPSRVSEAGEAGAILTAYEAAGLDLSQTRLVVLSACDTGTGLQSRGQEVQGLRWGFRASGAQALVTSLWRSNDVATRKLMKNFYSELLSSAQRGEADVLSGAAALRAAQLARVADEKRLGVKRPLVWANFVFSGVL